MPRRTDFWLALVLLLALAGALAFRLPKLGDRPMHGDEANQAYKTGVLLETGEYRYDPNEHHGPTLYYMTLPILWAEGAKSFEESREDQYRLLPALFGAALLLLLWPLRKDLGAVAMAVAAVLTTLSPAMVFYSRYYVQEMLLVFFTFAAIVSLWRYAAHRKLAWAILAGISLGLMHATKETAILAYAALAAGVIGMALTEGWRESWRAARQNLRPAHAAALLGAAAVVSAVLFSSFFTHPRGVLDSVLTYASYMKRADGAGLHDQPWYYYLQTLLYVKRPFGPRWSEGFIVGLAMVGTVAALPPSRADRPDRRLARFLAFYTITLTVLYSLIPYKTPWCLLSFLHGMVLLAGIGAAALFRWARIAPARAVVAIALAAGTWHLGGQAYRASFVYASDLRNPYVYAHPVTGVKDLAQRMEELAALSPKGHDLLIRVMSPGGDYWPLPWYLRRFSRVGYYADVPPEVDGDVIVAVRDMQPVLDSRLKNGYQVQFYGLRPNVILLVYVRQDLWDAFMATRS